MLFLCLHVVSVPTMARAGKSAAGNSNEETALRTASPNDGGGARKLSTTYYFKSYGTCPNGPISVYECAYNAPYDVGYSWEDDGDYSSSSTVPRGCYYWPGTWLTSEGLYYESYDVSSSLL